MNKVHRVVVTGLGSVNPLGLTAKSSFKALLEGKVAIQKLPNSEGFKSRIGGMIPEGFEMEKYETSMGKSLLHSVANCMTQEALSDAGVLDPNSDHIIDRDHFGISLATVVGEEIDRQNLDPSKRDFFRTYKFSLPSVLAYQHQLRGSQDISQQACAAGLFGIGQAFRLVKHGYLTAAVGGGVDINLYSRVHAFLDKLNATNVNCNDTPQTAVKPFD